MKSKENKETELWNKLVSEGLGYAGETNTTLPFGQMSKKYGKAWVEYVRAAWECRDDLSVEEFCRLNGGVPSSFVQKSLGG